MDYRRSFLTNNKLKTMIHNLQKYPSNRRRRLILIELKKLDKFNARKIKLHEIYFN